MLCFVRFKHFSRSQLCWLPVAPQQPLMEGAVMVATVAVLAGEMAAVMAVENGGGNGGGDGGGDGGGNGGGDGQNDVPIVALIMTGQNTNFSIFDDVVLVDGEDVLSAAALEYGNASGILRGHESVVNSNGMLFICSEGNDSIAVYDSFLTASGTRMPDRVVTG